MPSRTTLRMAVRKRFIVFGRPLLYIEVLILLRQARDKHRESTQDNAFSAGFFLTKPKQETSSGLSGGDCPNSARAGPQPTWDFRNKSAVDYFVKYVVGQWAEDNVTGAKNALFGAVLY